MGTLIDELREKAEGFDENAIEEPVVEEPQTETEAETEEPQEEPQQETEEPVIETEEPAAGSEEPVEYKPDHNYSFKDESFEFDDKVKGMIKSKEDEQMFRDLFTAQKAQEAYKGFGSLREIESKMGEYETLTETQAKYNELDTEINVLGGMLQKGNIEQFRQHLGIPKEQLLEWAIKEAKAIENPEYAQELNNQYQIDQQTFNLQQQNEMLHNRIDQGEIQQKVAELDSGLENSEVSKVASAYDEMAGKPGSFRQAIIDHGTNIFHTQGRNIEVSEAVQAVTQKFQGLVKSEAVGTQQDPNTQDIQQVNTQPVQQVAPKSNPDQTVVINQGGKQTIPNLQSGSGAPAKKVVKSLADIRKIAQSLPN